MNLKLFLFLFIIIAIYLLGISTGHYKFFPFEVLYNFKTEIYQKGSDKRYLNVSNLEEIRIPVNNKTGIYLTYGQSNAANHGQIGYEVQNKVYQYLNGKIYIYQDPSLGATGKDGSVWGMVGDKLIKKSIHDKVIFSNNGWGGRSMKDLSGEPYLNYLIKNYEQLIKDFGRVDAILFHQGEINHTNKLGNADYYRNFKILIQKLRTSGIEIPFYFSRTSICKNETDTSLIAIQNRIIQDLEMVLPGPNTDLLSVKKYRLPDNCHFSMLGFERFSDMWVESLINQK